MYNDNMIDFLIIGGGIVGVSIAHELSKYGVKTVLLEKEAELGFGVSKSNSGIVHTGFQSDHSTLKAKLAVRGNLLYRELARTLDFPFEEVGELVVAFPGQRDALGTIKANGEKLGIPGLEIVESDWIRENEPNLSSDLECALLGPTAAVINPYEVVYAMAESASANGVGLLCEQRVTSIEHGDDYWLVKTDDNQYETRHVINAAGLFADEIAKLAGIKVPQIIARKGEEFLIDKHSGHIATRVIFPVPSKVSKGILVIPTVDGNTMIGPTAYEIDDKEDLTTSHDGKEEVLSKVSALVPTIHDEQIIASFAGLRPATREGDFYIKEDQPGFINVVGIQSPGLTAAPAIAEYVVKSLISDLFVDKDKLHSCPDKGNGEKQAAKENHSSYRAKGLELTEEGARQAIPRLRELNEEQRNELIKRDPEYGEIICRCEMVSKGEIKEAVRRGARTLDGIKFRTRSQMGRCHGTFCTMKIIDVMAKELGVKPEAITKRGKGSELLIP